jgi:transcriptional regulator with AAA-type ATPase domain
MTDEPTATSPIFVAAGDDDALRLPDSADLLKHLRFSPRDGKITLGDERMLLVHLGALVALRGELVAALGVDRARAILTRMGYVSGHRDGEYARRLRGGASYFELLAAGPQLHALEGMVCVTPLEVQFDVPRGRFRGEFAWRNSAEVEAHLASHGRAAEPVCWMLVGYASGYTSVFMGRPVIYRELGCRACGARRCRIVGTALGDEAPPPEFAFLAPDRAVDPGGAAVRSVVAPGPDECAVDVIGQAAGLRAAWSLLERVAATELPVLLTGEPGVGKRHLARAVHARSRRAGPLVALRAGGLRPDELDAAMARARDGSLLLADLAEASPELQARLLHALERGDAAPRWLVTTREELRRTGALRPELQHRLGMFPVHVPPLRERREDIPLLLHRFLREQSIALGKPLPGITERANDALLDHDYPGNVGELWGLVARAAVLVDPGEAIDRGQLFGEHERGPTRLALDDSGGLQPVEAEDPSAAPGAAPEGLIDALLDHPLELESLEQTLIRRAVERAGGNLSAAARMLGLTRPQLAYRHRKGDG